MLANVYIANFMACCKKWGKSSSFGATRAPELPPWRSLSFYLNSLVKSVGVIRAWKMDFTGVIRACGAIRDFFLVFSMAMIGIRNAISRHFFASLPLIDATIYGSEASKKGHFYPNYPTVGQLKQVILTIFGHLEK